MGIREERRRAREGAPPETLALAPPIPDREFSDDPACPVPISAKVTEADRLRLRKLGIEMDLSLQRMTHLAWNAFLASHGQPGLTPVLQGKRKSG